MGKTSGCILILAGIALGAYALQPGPRAGSDLAAAQMPHNPETSQSISGDAPLDQSGSASKAVPDGGAPVPAVKTAGAPAATTPSTAPQPAAGAAPAPQPAPKATPDRGKPQKTARGKKSGPPPVAGVAPPTLLLAPSMPVLAKQPRGAVTSVSVDDAPPRVPVGEVKAPGPTLDGAALTREIQRQLKRVGCYQGELTGVWTPAVRQAMHDFTERANASLPVSEPDPVLLAMVQSHAPGVCSAECPRGQERGAGGHCVPSALVTADKAAKAAKTAKTAGSAGTADKATSAKTAKAGAEATKKAAAGPAKKRAGDGLADAGATPDASTVTPPTSHRPQEGRMSLAGPPPVAPHAKATQAGRQPRVAGWSRSVRPRERRAQRPAYKGYSGLPSWANFLFP